MSANTTSVMCHVKLQFETPVNIEDWEAFCLPRNIVFDPQHAPMVNTYAGYALRIELDKSGVEEKHKGYIKFTPPEEFSSMTLSFPSANEEKAYMLIAEIGERFNAMFLSEVFARKINQLRALLLMNLDLSPLRNISKEDLEAALKEKMMRYPIEDCAIESMDILAFDWKDVHPRFWSRFRAKLAHKVLGLRKEINTVASPLLSWLGYVDVSGSSCVLATPYKHAVATAIFQPLLPVEPIRMTITISDIPYENAI